MELTFRTLNANEIDCRIQSVTEKGLILLLYKDARVDQKLLDEVVGPMNWQKEYTRDNANCIVSIWDVDKKMWIKKEDTGTESNTEKEKGLASDSFKRACFNWGIGRELYSAPFIWITAENCKIFKDNQGKSKCNDKFFVKAIEYNNDREIIKLVIVNLTTKGVVYNVDKTKKQEEQPKAENKPVTKATPEQVARIMNLYNTDEIKEALKLVIKDKLEDLTLVEASSLISKRSESK